MLNKILSTFAVKVTAAILNLLLVILVSRYLGAEGRGEISLLLVTITVLLNFTYLFGGGTLVYLIPRTDVFQLFIPSYIWCFIVSLCGYFLILSIKSIPTYIAFHASILALLNGWFYINTTILLGKEEIGANNLLRLLHSFLTITFVIVFFLLFKKVDISAYILSLYIAFSFCFLLSLLKIKKYFVFSFTKFREHLIPLLKMGFLNQVGDVLLLLCLRLNFYILNKYSGEAALGVYSNATAITEAILLITGSITVVQYSKIANSKDKQYSLDLTFRLTRISILVCSILLIPLLLLPSGFFIFIFGADFKEIPLAIQALAPGILFYNIGLIISHYFEGTGKYKVKAISAMLGLIVMVISSLIILPSFGLIEAGIISSLSYFTFAFSLVFFLSKENIPNYRFLLPTIKDIEFIKTRLSSITKGF